MSAERSEAKRGLIPRSPAKLLRSRTKGDSPFLTTWVEIRLDTLGRNIRAIRRTIPDPKTEILAIVKADAYGHGMKKVAMTLAEEGVSFFGVANIDEAAELRGVCPRAKILVLGSFHQSQIPLYREMEIIPTISSVEDVKNLSVSLRGAKQAFSVHVKIDTGMGRLGVWHLEFEKLFLKLEKEKNIFVEGIYTHFSCADHKLKDATHRQLKIFNEMIQKTRTMGFRPKVLHAANSMGLLNFKEAHFNLVRPGIILYGLNPNSLRRLPPGIRPILSWKTRISFIKQVESGRTVSYGATHKVTKKTRIATLPVGYSHGYRVGLSGKAAVLVRGKRCPVTGRVTMDHTMIDVGAVPGVKRWETVTLIGLEQKAAVTAEELAKLLQSIPYEIVCSIHSRVPRLYRGR